MLPVLQSDRNVYSDAAFKFFKAAVLGVGRRSNPCNDERGEKLSSPLLHHSLHFVLKVSESDFRLIYFRCVSIRCCWRLEFFFLVPSRSETKRASQDHGSSKGNFVALWRATRRIRTSSGKIVHACDPTSNTRKYYLQFEFGFVFSVSPKLSITVVS